jgi:Zn-dependent peptidase ImmA (M78 family)
MTWIKEKVNSITEKYNTNDPFEIAHAMHIHVYQRDLHNEIMGFYKYIRRNKFIFINSNLNDDTQLFTCAHELGHSQLHPRTNTPFLRSNTLLSVDKIEHEANRFAVELLMSDRDLYELKDSNMTIYDAAAMYGVPQEVCHLKKFDFSIGT